MNNTKVIRVSAKCSDMFTATFHDKDDNFIGEYDGYVPDFFPGQHYGDYVILDIDIETGKILNWKAPTQEEISNLINGKNEKLL